MDNLRSIKVLWLGTIDVITLNLPFVGVNECFEGYFFTWKCYVPEEYTPLRLFFQFFHQWISTFVRVDKNCVFTLENVIYLINIHLCMNVFQFFHWRMSTFVCVDKNGVSYTWICFYLKNIHLCTSWLNWCFLHWKIFSTWRTYSSFVSVSLKNIYICASWIKWCFPHLKIFFTWRINTSLWVLLNVFDENSYLCVSWLK